MYTMIGYPYKYISFIQNIHTHGLYVSSICMSESILYVVSMMNCSVLLCTMLIVQSI